LPRFAAGDKRRIGTLHIAPLALWALFGATKVLNGGGDEDSNPQVNCCGFCFAWH
jgi:hypothetical protein